MLILKNTNKKEMEQAMKAEAKKAYSACTDDCPRCRVSDG